uniref:Phosducin domain-containing protein n=1 Tax=Glossina brevipalpis TaxID=37001 RepID=A0A1A9W376_9MUSC
MEEILEEPLVEVPEKQIGERFEHLDNLNADNVKAMRKRRIKEMKEMNRKKQKWMKNGHGTYSELADEKEFFEISKKSLDIVCHFYEDANELCRIFDVHLEILAGKHLEAKFCKVNVENSPFLKRRLRMKVIPTIVLIKNRKTKDFIVGFTDFGNYHDFSTDVLEWRLAQSGTIDYKGDLTTPPNMERKSFIKRKAVRGGYDPDDSDTDSDD